jgi:NAD-dependent dihydropyrimidine dehydrogenase PreA subunit
MAYVIAEPCIGQKDNSCVEVCPADCIHPTPDDPAYESPSSCSSIPRNASIATLA